MAFLFRRPDSGQQETSSLPLHSRVNHHIDMSAGNLRIRTPEEAGMFAFPLPRYTPPYACLDVLDSANTDCLNSGKNCLPVQRRRGFCSALSVSRFRVLVTSA